VFLFTEHPVAEKTVRTLNIFLARPAIGYRGQRAFAAVCGIGIAVSPTGIADRVAVAVQATGAAMVVYAFIVADPAVVQVGIEVEALVGSLVAVVVIAVTYLWGAFIDEVPGVGAVRSQAGGADAMLVVVTVEAAGTQSGYRRAEIPDGAAIREEAAIFLDAAVGNAEPLAVFTVLGT